MKDQQTPFIPISWGELFDKIAILEIKKKKIKSPNSLANVEKELTILSSVKDSLLKNDTHLDGMIGQLSLINMRLWDIEDNLREKEKMKEFDQIFIDLARSVYIENDRRAAIKRQINEFLSSELKEEKSYTGYIIP